MTPKRALTKPVSPHSKSASKGSTDEGAQDEQQDIARDWLVHTLYTLTYGGGLVAGDCITLNITLSALTRLIVLTQGSTKIFKSPSRDIVSRQDLSVEIGPEAALVYLPDPVQPFERSCFRQAARYEILPGAGDEDRGSMCVLDWVSRGRAARGEEWGFWKYGSRNEIFLVSDKDHEKKRLLLRDNLVLDVGAQEEDVGSVALRMDGKGVFGTLILFGSLFEELRCFFMDEFKATPRIGSKKWDSGSGDEEEITDVEIRRRDRQKQENLDGLLWSAASVRGCVVVKFGAREVEGGRQWIRSMLETEGTVVDQFGERVLMCLR